MHTLGSSLLITYSVYGVLVCRFQDNNGPKSTAIAAPNDEKEDFTSDGRNDAYTIASSFSAVNNSMAFTDCALI
jgi:hypothetical protein